MKYIPPTQPNDFNASNLSLYFNPYFQLQRGKWLATLSLPLKAQRYFSQQRSFLFFNPSTYLRYKLDYHWTFSLYGSLKRSAGDFLSYIRDFTKPTTAPGETVTAFSNEHYADL